jgi:hypothetical protein
MRRTAQDARVTIDLSRRGSHPTGLRLPRGERLYCARCLAQAAVAAVREAT